MSDENIHKNIHVSSPVGLHSRSTKKRNTTKSPVSLWEVKKLVVSFIFWMLIHLSVTSIFLLWCCTTTEPLTSSLHTCHFARDFLAALLNATINRFAVPLVLVTETLLLLCRIWECFLKFQCNSSSAVTCCCCKTLFVLLSSTDLNPSHCSTLHRLLWLQPVLQTPIHLTHV